MSQPLNLTLSRSKPALSLSFAPQPSNPAELAAVAVGLSQGLSGAPFLVSNKLGEIAADPESQQAAQQNLGLGVTDPLAYYILAKA